VTIPVVYSPAVPYIVRLGANLLATHLRYAGIVHCVVDEEIGEIKR
jgi:hypothetical protein